MIGSDLKELRKKKNISQKQVSKDLNISRQSISKWENDVCYPDVKNLKRLSEYYNVPLGNFIDGNNCNSIIKPDFKNKQILIGKTKDVAEKDEGLILLVITLMCFILPPMGIIVIPIVFKRNKAENTLHTLVYIACILCFIVNVFISYGIIIDLLSMGDTSVELLK